jgi:dsRNA-specific ribonuclease
VPARSSAKHVHLQDVTRRLVTNSTFSYLSSAYGLLDRLEFGYSDNLTRNQKVAADLFEAYVGALDKCETLAPGSTELWSWLGALYTPEVWCDLAPTVRRLEDVIRASTRSNATGTPAT